MTLSGLGRNPAPLIPKSSEINRNLRTLPAAWTILYAVRVTLKQDLFVKLQVLIVNKFLIRNLFEEVFEQAFRKREDIVTDIERPQKANKS